MNKIFDIEFKSAQKCSEHFDEILVDDDYGYWESKKTFHHEEEDLTFNFKYVIEYGVAWDKKPTGIYQLVLIPTKEFWHESVLQDVLACSGIEYGDVNLMDACSHGGPVVNLGLIHTCEVGEDNYEPSEEVLEAQEWFRFSELSRRDRLNVVRLFEKMTALSGFKQRTPVLAL